MKLSDARELIEAAFHGKTASEKWADLGCGNGLFTNALAGFLGQGSAIYAVDKTFQSVQPVNHNVEIEFIQNDFEKGISGIENLDGILMANSFHYIRHKEKLIEKLIQNLKPDGKLIIVEYETQKANQWVPFPIGFSELQQLFMKYGFEETIKTGERNSVYSTDKMYSALIRGRKIYNNN